MKISFGRAIFCTIQDLMVGCAMGESEKGKKCIAVNTSPHCCKRTHILHAMWMNGENRGNWWELNVGAGVHFWSRCSCWTLCTMRSTFEQWAKVKWGKKSETLVWELERKRISTRPIQIGLRYIQILKMDQILKQILVWGRGKMMKGRTMSKIAQVPNNTKQYWLIVLKKCHVGAIGTSNFQNMTSWRNIIVVLGERCEKEGKRR